METDRGTKRILTIFLHQFYCQLWPSKEESKLSYKYQVIILTGRTKCPMHRATSDGKGAACRSVSSRCGVLASKDNSTVILDILHDLAEVAIHEGGSAIDELKRTINLHTIQLSTSGFLNCVYIFVSVSIPGKIRYLQQADKLCKHAGWKPIQYPQYMVEN